MPLAALAIAAALLAPSAARAQQDPILGGLLGTLGLTTPEPPQIDYRERPPLVVPPRSTLPSPQDRENARRAANWPEDDTEARRRALRADADMPATERERYRLNQRDRLSGDELSRGRTSARAQVRPREYFEGNSAAELQLEPIRRMREVDAERAARAAEIPVGQEPPRRFLIEPPVGYRAATERVRPASEPVTRRENDGVREFLRGERF
jgi:hypothetical protein